MKLLEGPKRSDFANSASGTWAWFKADKRWPAEVLKWIIALAIPPLAIICIFLVFFFLDEMREAFGLSGDQVASGLFLGLMLLAAGAVVKCGLFSSGDRNDYDGW